MTISGGDERVTDEIGEEERYRAGAYSLLAALMRREPDTALLSRLDGLAETPGEGELGAAMATLGLAARSADTETLKHEYFALFIGIGRGELLPYGSWYQTGFLMERPLGDLRTDLARLGFARESGTAEPEDHVAALCEVMSMLAVQADSHESQREFFSRHMGPWLERFFADLAVARSASFYRAVARFGSAFTGFEKAYLGMDA